MVHNPNWLCGNPGQESDSLQNGHRSMVDY